MENFDYDFNFEKVEKLKSAYLSWSSIGSCNDIFSTKDLVCELLPDNIKVDKVIDLNGSPEVYFINQNREGYCLKNSQSGIICCFIINFDNHRRIINLDGICKRSFAKFSKAYFQLLDERVTNDDKIIAEKKIKLSLQSIMKNLDCEYFIEKNRLGFVLNVKLSTNKIVTISISYKGFMNQLPKIDKTIKEFQRIEGDSGLLTTIIYYDDFEIWKDDR